jgi:hypothetical protein
MHRKLTGLGWERLQCDNAVTWLERNGQVYWT